MKTLILCVSLAINVIFFIAVFVAVFSFKALSTSKLGDSIKQKFKEAIVDTMNVVLWGDEKRPIKYDSISKVRYYRNYYDGKEKHETD